MLHTRPFDQTRKLLNIAIPIGMIEAVGHLLVLTDLIIVGRLGALEFAAVGLAITFFWTFVVVGISVISVIGVLIAEKCAFAVQEDETGLYGAHGLWVCILMIVILAPAIGFMSDFLTLTGLQRELLPHIEAYTHAVVWALAPALLFAWLRSIFTGIEILTPITLIAIIAVPTNVALSMMLVFGMGPLPGYGVAGAGYATALVNLAMFVALSIYLRRQMPTMYSALKANFLKVEHKILKHLLHVGGGQGVITLLENGMFAVVAVLVGSLSVEALAAHNMVYAVLELCILIVLGFGEGTMIRVANSIGINNYVMAYRVCGIALVFSIVIAAIMSSALVLSPGLISALFLSGDNSPSEDDVRAVLATFVVAASLSLLFDATQTVLYHAIRATRDEYIPVLIAFFGYWIVGLGCGYVFGFILGFGIAGIWTGLAIGFCAITVLMGVRLHYRLRHLEAHLLSPRL
ncbi:putative multidrug resistance protein NorM [Pseudomonas reidholzensis]|uniref:Putative multidrug resistance protein NorM n=1 Tax=Pseudomonas reidholzensis TaxID=1785162 RepID=A0A383RVX2_9PSED|nr:MATE family efflux transporter [Pseudomonas reidholzensis]SYX90538.1 putative multidrug resistance protein NorM [Pseudomonas reidholzensis]